MSTRARLHQLLALGLCLLLSASCHQCTPAVTGDQPDDRAHPFQSSVDGVITRAEQPPAASGVRALPADLVATETRTRTVSLPGGQLAGPLELVATPEVSDAALAYLAKSLRVVPGDPRSRKDMQQMLSEKPQLQRGQPEVWLPPVKNPNLAPAFLGWADGWQMVRPGVLRLLESYRKVDAQAAGRDDSVGVSTAALIGNWTSITGTLVCAPPGAAPAPLPFVTVELGDAPPAATDRSGAFTLTGSYLEVTRLLVRYNGTVVSPAASSPMQVMDDVHDARSEWVDVTMGGPTSGALNVGTLTLTSADCELFLLGTQALDEYHGITSSSPPAGRFRIKRWGGDVVSGPYSYYDYALFPTDILAERNTRERRRATVFHEFGHTVRHVADGDSSHWDWDNFRWVYARFHNTREVFNEHYAFNEGWAQYWECTRSALPAGACPAIGANHPGVNFMDWNEMRVAQRLQALAAAPGVGHAAMDAILRANPGSIHRLIEFEQRYCTAVALPNPFCSGAGAPTRTKPACPPGFDDHGATCYQPDVVAKDSYIRQGGSLPLGCAGGADEDLGLCYAPCAAGWDGVGPLCWQDCPAGMQDDGAFCRRDVNIRPSDNSACPWWDVCGVTFASGCSVCPAGFQNDGCFCRVDAWIFAKATRGRGIGTPMTNCGAAREYDAGLCYDRCRPGFNGVASVCWGQCDPGFEDHGATCWRPPNILVKF